MTSDVIEALSTFDPPLLLGASNFVFVVTLTHYKLLELLVVTV